MHTVGGGTLQPRLTTFVEAVEFQALSPLGPRSPGPIPRAVEAESALREGRIARMIA